MNFKRYVEASDTWVDSHYIKGTDTDTITTLPATIYPLAQSVTIGLKGNTVQSGTPTPDSPVPVVGVGDLDNGNYKIPISSANTTTPVYLGEVETTRKIRKLVLTGGEDNWGEYARADSSKVPFLPLSDFKGASSTTAYADIICTHYDKKAQVNIQNLTNRTGIAGRTSIGIIIADETKSTLADFKAYLAQQYAAGTPVTVWYVLATPTTGIVNEPLMKIGDYADSLTTSIPCTAGENTLDVQTTVQPSEVTVTFEGWHPVSAAHERSGGAWD